MYSSNTLQTKFGSTKLKTNGKKTNRMSPTEFSNYIKQRALQKQNSNSGGSTSGNSSGNFAGGNTSGNFAGNFAGNNGGMRGPPPPTAPPPTQPPQQQGFRPLPQQGQNSGFFNPQQQQHGNLNFGSMQQRGNLQQQVNNMKFIISYKKTHSAVPSRQVCKHKYYIFSNLLPTIHAYISYVAQLLHCCRRQCHKHCTFYL